MAAERHASEINSHGVLSLVKEYKFWANLAMEQQSPESIISATRREQFLRKLLLRDCVHLPEGSCQK
jgi:hypothetical protein